MKIQLKCNTVDTPLLPKAACTIPPGTVFRWGDHACGPYLKVRHGYVDLDLNEYNLDNATPTLLNYKELPNARLVLE